MRPLKWHGSLKLFCHGGSLQCRWENKVTGEDCAVRSIQLRGFRVSGGSIHLYMSPHLLKDVKSIDWPLTSNSDFTCKLMTYISLGQTTEMILSACNKQLFKEVTINMKLHWSIWGISCICLFGILCAGCHYSRQTFQDALWIDLAFWCCPKSAIVYPTMRLIHPTTQFHFSV